MSLRAGRGSMVKSPKKPAANDDLGEVICEPGRHVNCLHAKMAGRRAAAKPR